MPAASSPPLPRGLIFLASIWLVGSWLVAIGLDPPVQPSSASYTPGVRFLLDCILVGVIFAWPLMRLSAPRCPWPVRRAALDAVVVAALLQLVLWPMRLVTPWSVPRTLAIDLVLVGWALAMAALLAIGGALDPRGRTLVMACCLMLAFLGPLAGPAADFLGSGPDTVNALALASPFTALRQLTGGGPAELAAQEWVSALTGPGLAAVLWLALGALAVMGAGGRHRPGRRHRPGPGGRRRADAAWRPPPDAGLSGQEPLSSSRHA